MNKFVRVAIPGPFNSLFDYYALNTTIAVGARVSIPFGGRKLIGIVMEIANSSDVPKEKIKFILGVLDETPLISKELMRLCQWASNYYHHPIGDVITNALPKLLREGRIAEKFQMPIWQLTEIGLNEEPENIKRSTKQRALLKFLKSIKKPISREELTQQSFDNATIQAFEKKGFIEKTILENEIKCIANPSPIQLNTSQQEAFDTIIKSINHFQPFLLNGVTGSGKTEIYLRAIEKIIIIPKL
jgi:primosomal protein N' (replication factor Y)